MMALQGQRDNRLGAGVRQSAAKPESGCHFYHLHGQRGSRGQEVKTNFL